MLTCVYMPRETHPKPVAFERLLSSKLGEELAMGIPLLTYWLDRVAKRFAFCLIVRSGDNIYKYIFHHHLAKWLKPLAENSPYSILKRGKEEELSLIIASKNWDYCLAGDKWEMDCKECELDLHGWKAGQGVGWRWFS